MSDGHRFGSLIAPASETDPTPPPAERSPFPGNDPVTGNAAFPVTAPPVWETGNVDNPPLYADVAALLDGTMPEPPEPVILTRCDDHGLFYAGQVNWLFGDPESGKTFVALAAAAEHLQDGGKVLLLDLDHNGLQAVIQRLLMLGAPAEALRDLDRFRYSEPEDAQSVLDVVTESRTWRPGIAVIDSIGELLPMFGASSNSPDEFTGVHSKVMKPLAIAGAAVICVDHMAKNSESRAYGATGTAAKNRAIGGVSLRVRIADTFVPGRGGSCHLSIHKDRHGGLRQHSPTGDTEPLAGTFVLSTDPVTEATSWELKAPAMTDRNPAEAVPAEDVAAVAALDPPARTVKDARERLGWRTERAAGALREHREETTFPVSHTGGRETGNAPERCPDCSNPLHQNQCIRCLTESPTP